MPMALKMETSFVKPRKLQLLAIFAASITTAISGVMLVTAYSMLNAPTVDRNPVLYQFVYPEPYDRPSEFKNRLFS
jgi:hypothetical protein